MILVSNASKGSNVSNVSKASKGSEMGAPMEAEGNPTVGTTKVSRGGYA